MAMSLDRIAPELRPAVRRMALPLPINRKWGRAVLRTLMRLTRGVSAADVSVHSVKNIGAGIRIYRPSERSCRGALLWIHGGGYLIGSAIQDDRFCVDTARSAGIVVVSADYRLSPDHHFPAAHDDCHAAWTWMQREAGNLDIAPDMVAIGGQSAGGGLAAGLVQRIVDEDRERNGAKPIAQWLFCPMLDDRTGADRTLDAIGHRIWNNGMNRYAWQAYLGKATAAAGEARYAVPGRRRNLAGMPQTWIGVGDIDLFHDEDVDYGKRLRAAGVAVDTVVVDGGPHGFESWASNSEIATTYLSGARAWLKRRFAEWGTQERDRQG